MPNDYEFLFQLQRIHQMRTLSQFGLVKFWFKNEMVHFYTLDQQRNIIIRLMHSWNSKKNYDESLKASLIYNIIMPILTHQKESGKLSELIGQFCLEGDTDLVGQMIKTVVEADSETQHTSDELKVAILRLSQFLVCNLSDYIPEKGDRFRLKRLVEYGMPCMEKSGTMDPSTKYHGHLLLAHLISKFQMKEQIMLDAFEKLLKAFSLETKSVVNEAIDLFVKKIFAHQKDKQDVQIALLPKYTRKVLIEEGQTLRAPAQLSHVVQARVRNEPNLLSKNSVPIEPFREKL